VSKRQNCRSIRDLAIGNLWVRFPFSSAGADVRQRLILAFLHPAVPRLESLPVDDDLGARDVFLDIIMEEVFAALVADTANASPGAPLGAVDLQDTVRVTGRCLRASYLLRVHAALALHEADPVADEASADPSSLQLLHGVALLEYLALRRKADDRDEDS